MTRSPAEFAPLMRTNPAPNVGEEQPEQREAYRYSKVPLNKLLQSFLIASLHITQSSAFLMRSQLDCHDERLPGTGVFDLKTRASFPIRMDLLNYKVYSNNSYPCLNMHQFLFCRKMQDIIYEHSMVL